MTYSLYVGRIGVPVQIEAVQNTNAVSYNFEIADWPIPPGATAKIYIKKPSGTEIYTNCQIDGQTVLFAPTLQSFAELGTSEAQLQIISGEKVMVSFVFCIKVHNNLIDDSAIESTNEYTALTQALQTVTSYDTRIAEAQSAADAAQQTADSKLEPKGDGSDLTVTFTEASNTTPPASGSTLSVMLGRIKKLFTRVTKLEPVTLYTGTTIKDSLTLSQSAANFERLGIYMTDNNGKNVTYQELLKPNNKEATLMVVDATSTALTVQLRCTCYSISGTVMTLKQARYATITTTPAVTANNYIIITRIVGYR